MTATTLSHAVAYSFVTNVGAKFAIGKKIYQHVKTVYDYRELDGGQNEIEVAYDYKTQAYVCFNISDPKVGNKKITII